MFFTGMDVSETMNVETETLNSETARRSQIAKVEHKQKRKCEDGGSAEATQCHAVIQHFRCYVFK